MRFLPGSSTWAPFSHHWALLFSKVSYQFLKNGNSFSLISIMIYFSKQLHLISLNHSSSLIKENESLNKKCKGSECEKQAQVSYDFKEKPQGLRENRAGAMLKLDCLHMKPITRMDHSQQLCLENLSILFPNKRQA